jgi:transcriptional regulator with XRE-family HTH domain
MEVGNIKDRILEFLKAENKSSAHFAQEIGVQPSAISHIISGRNKPSLDFVMKMIGKYPFLSSEWLLFGKGSMYPDKYQNGLFSAGTASDNRDNDVLSAVKQHDTFTMESAGSEKTGDKTPVSAKTLKNKKKAARIVVFYDDDTFTEHFPGGE